MRRFVRTCLLASIFPIGLLLLVNSLFMHTNYYRTLNGIEKFNHLPETIQIANFGSSHSLDAFDWSVVPDVRGSNMAMSSQTLVCDNAVFSQFYDRFETGATAIVDISFRALYEPEKSVADGGSRVTRYYPLLSRKNIYNYDFETALRYRYLPVFGVDRKQLSYIIHDKDDVDVPRKNVIVTDVYSPDGIVVNGRSRAEGFLEQSGDQQLGVQFDAVLKIVEKCRAKDMHLVFVTCPTLPYFSSEFPKAFLDRYYADIAYLCSLYDKAVYIDFTDDARFCDDLSLFSDTNHLNVNGAKVMTRIMLEELAARGIVIDGSNAAKCACNVSETYK